MLVTTMPHPEIRDLIMKSFIKPVERVQGDERKLFIARDAKVGWKSSLERIQEVERQRFGATRKLEGQNSAKAGIGMGYAKNIERNTISISRVISGEAMKALEAHELADMATNVRKDVEDKIFLDMRNFLGYATGASSYTDNGGFTIDLTTADGLAAFHATHTLKFSSTTYSNILSGAPALSEASLDTALDFFTYNRLDNFGKPLASPQRLTIITSNKATMVNRAKRILGSASPEAVEGTANGNAGVLNVNRNRYSHLVIDFDQDSLGNWNTALSFYWFVAALDGSEEDRLKFYYVRWMSPTMGKPEIKEDPWVISMTGRAAYGLGAVSAKDICVSKANS